MCRFPPFIMVKKISSTVHSGLGGHYVVIMPFFFLLLKRDEDIF